MKINAPLPSAIRTALGAVGLEWDPALVESIQPVVVLADASSQPASSGASGLPGFSYAGFAFIIPAAGNNGHVQVWNPTDSGRDVYVDMVHAYTTSATGQAASFRTHNVALTTLVGKTPATDLEATAAAAEIRTQQNAAILGTEVISFASPSALAQFNLRPPTPYRLPPGFGLHAVFHSQPSATFATFFIREVVR